MVQPNGVHTHHQHATIRFQTPDPDNTPDLRAIFAPPACLEILERQVPIYDIRTDPHVVHGPEGIDKQGFAYIKHESALKTEDDYFTGTKVDDVYLPETEALAKRVLGARRVVVNSVGVRRKPASKARADPKFYWKRGELMDKELAEKPKDASIWMGGRTLEKSMEAVRFAHVDNTVTGLRRFVRYGPAAVVEAAKDSVKREDSGTNEAPRYASFSVWRPIKPVKRDPLAVCDWRTLDPQHELAPFEFRTRSSVAASGEFVMQGFYVVPSKTKPTKQKWYWLPEQKPDELLFIKLADTLSEVDGAVAAGCPHTSLGLEGAEVEEPRNSIECRVTAFW